MGTRQTMAWLINHLRDKVHDCGLSSLETGQYYIGDTIRLSNEYANLSGHLENPTSPKVTVWDSYGTKRLDSAIPTNTGETGKYYYDYRIPENSPEGVWRGEFTGVVNSNIREFGFEFSVVISNRVWSNEQLQNILDMHRTHIVREMLTQGVDKETYYSRWGMLEDNVKLWDGKYSSSTEIPSDAYSANLVDGVFTFSQSHDEAYYLDGVSYNLHGAIAECMEQLAMDPNKAKSWTRGSVKYTHYDYLEIARYHRNLSGVSSIAINRVYS